MVAPPREGPIAERNKREAPCESAKPTQASNLRACSVAMAAHNPHRPRAIRGSRIEGPVQRLYARQSSVSQTDTDDGAHARSTVWRAP